MKVKEYTVLSDCVERGVVSGIARAHKHTDTPTPETVRDLVIVAVINEICEYFNFDDEPNSAYKDTQ